VVWHLVNKFALTFQIWKYVFVSDWLRRKLEFCRSPDLGMQKSNLDTQFHFRTSDEQHKYNAVRTDKFRLCVYRCTIHFLLVGVSSRLWPAPVSKQKPDKESRCHNCHRNNVTAHRTV
jgi:hypothetical protein